MTDYLLDTNIILRIVQSSAPTHTVAVEAVASILTKGDNIFITPQVLIEFWAVATRPVGGDHADVQYQPPFNLQCCRFPKI